MLVVFHMAAKLRRRLSHLSRNSLVQKFGGQLHKLRHHAVNRDLAQGAIEDGPYLAVPRHVGHAGQGVGPQERGCRRQRAQVKGRDRSVMQDEMVPRSAGAGMQDARMIEAVHDRSDMHWQHRE